VLSAIQFDDELLAQGDKIHDVRPDGALALEFHAQPPGAQKKPQTMFRVRHGLAQFPRPFDLLFSHREYFLRMKSRILEPVDNRPLL
jgi:hypothetical protein